MIINKKIGVISLGCDKNRVDTEKMLKIVSKYHQIVSDDSEIDILIINTCAFLESSRKEAVDEILTAIRKKEQGLLEKIIVTGCLPQKFIGDIFDELPEVDAFLGVSDYKSLNKVIDKIYDGERAKKVNPPKNEKCIKRVRTTPYYAYLKIADGCDNHCTYCLIPKIRGKFRSINYLDLIKEAKSLKKVKELILVAQDTAAYGKDLGKNINLTFLIKELSKLNNIEKIRLLYCYPENITDELIEEIKTNPKVIKYIDIPLQHADDRILKLMNRKGTFDGYLSLINKLKKEIDGIAIRSTFIAGFQTETQENFDRLVEFIKRAKLFNAGFFAYSKEEGTPAYKLDGDVVNSEKIKRVKKLYSVQKAVVKENFKQFIGKTVKVLAEGFDENTLCYYGRAYFNAPDIDGKVYFFSSSEVKYGNYYDIKINESAGYDLYGERI